MVLHSPPRVIDTEGEANTDDSVFLDWARDYSEWWATQSYGLLGSPIEPQVSLFYSLCKTLFMFHLLCFSFKTFDGL